MIFCFSLNTKTQPQRPKYLPSTFKYISLLLLSGFIFKDLSRNLSKCRLKVPGETFEPLNLLNDSIVTLVEIQVLNRLKYLLDFIFFLGVNVFLHFKHLKRRVPNLDLP